MDFAFFAIAFNIKKMCAKKAIVAPNDPSGAKNTPKTLFFELTNCQNRVACEVGQKWAA
jgi:hypothetical protein